MVCTHILRLAQKGLGCPDDNSRLLGQPHSRVEQAHQPVLHYPDDGGWLGQLAPGSRASDVSLPRRGVASLPPQPPEPQASDEWLEQNAPGSWDSAP